jgi:chromosomal replication initiation ATPase DnaA
MEQLQLFDQRNASYDCADFIKLQSNNVALEGVSGWPDTWRGNSMLILGQQNTGKTHLAQIWLRMSGARIITAETLASLGHTFAALEDTSAVVMDLHPIEHEVNALHILNIAKERGIWLLVTARPETIQALALPDLRSRILSIPTVNIDSNGLSYPQVHALVCKCMTDHQIKLSRAQYCFIARRLTRSIADVRRFCDAVNDHVMNTQRRPTRAELVEMMHRP